MKYRLLQIFFADPKELKSVHIWQYNHHKILEALCVKIIYTFFGTFHMILYGFDGSIKWQSKTARGLDALPKIIAAMPLGNTRFCGSDKKDSIPFCDIPTTGSTGHCFQDSTHRTCCLLGGQARAYADRSGNPIGRAAEHAFFENYGFYPDERTLTPWCTCIGSKVCSYYSQKFNDGTHIKYIDSLTKGIVLREDENRFSTVKHSTPGIPKN